MAFEIKCIETMGMDPRSRTLNDDLEHELGELTKKSVVDKAEAERANKSLKLVGEVMARPLSQIPSLATEAQHCQNFQEKFQLLSRGIDHLLKQHSTDVNNYQTIRTTLETSKHENATLLGDVKHKHEATEKHMDAKDKEMALKDKELEAKDKAMDDMRNAHSIVVKALRDEITGLKQRLDT